MHHPGRNLSAIFSIFLLLGCSEINDSWEVKGGGYFKYTVNGGSSYTIELDDDDVVRPDYGRSYFQDCRNGECEAERKPIHIKGRLRYWISEDDR